MSVVLALLLAACVALRVVGRARFGERAELGEKSMLGTLTVAGVRDAQLVVAEDNVQRQAVVLLHVQAEHRACHGGLQAGGGHAVLRNMLFQKALIA